MKDQILEEDLHRVIGLAQALAARKQPSREDILYTLQTAYILGRSAGRLQGIQEARQVLDRLRPNTPPANLKNVLDKLAR